MNATETSLLQNSHAVLRYNLCLSLAAISLAGCVATSVPEAINANERLQGHGFSINAPSDRGWTFSSRKPDAIVFHKHSNTTTAQGDRDVPYALSAGVLAFSDDSIAMHRETGFTGTARNILARRISAPDRNIVSLDVTPERLHDAVCAAYQAVQVDRYFPERLEERNEHEYRGLLCIHPSAPTLLVQLFYNEQFLRDAPPARRVNANEAKAFFTQLRWTALSR